MQLLRCDPPTVDAGGREQRRASHKWLCQINITFILGLAISKVFLPRSGNDLARLEPPARTPRCQQARHKESSGRASGSREVRIGVKRRIALGDEIGLHVSGDVPVAVVLERVDDVGVVDDPAERRLVRHLA